MDEALKAVGTLLLEPIEKLTVYSPSPSASHVTSALTARRGQILGLSPREDWRGLPLPANVALFAFPDGLRLESAPRAPAYFAFVLTFEDGTKLACGPREASPSLRASRMCRTADRAASKQAAVAERRPRGAKRIPSP